MESTTNTTSDETKALAPCANCGGRLHTFQADGLADEVRCPNCYPTGGIPTRGGPDAGVDPERRAWLDKIMSGPAPELRRRRFDDSTMPGHIRQRHNLQGRRGGYRY